MNEVFEKIIKKLTLEKFEPPIDGYERGFNHALRKSISIVEHEEDTYNNSWIPCKYKQPSKEGRYLVTAKNDLTGRKEVTIALWKQRQGGSYGWFRQGVHNKVIAWQPLPEEYAE